MNDKTPECAVDSAKEAKARGGASGEFECKEVGCEARTYFRNSGPIFYKDRSLCQLLLIRETRESQKVKATSS